MIDQQIAEGMERWFKEKKFSDKPYHFDSEIIRDDENNTIVKRVIAFDDFNKDLHGDIITPLLGQQTEILRSDYPDHNIKEMILTTMKVEPKDQAKEYNLILLTMVAQKAYHGILIYSVNHRVYIHSGTDMRIICMVNNDNQEFKLTIP